MRLAIAERERERRCRFHQDAKLQLQLLTKQKDQYPNQFPLRQKPETREKTPNLAYQTHRTTDRAFATSGGLPVPGSTSTRGVRSWIGSREGEVRQIESKSFLLQFNSVAGSTKW